ncbi:hypothetical protein KCU73_g13694, partial [Aureobasidium melanogenum]
MLSDVGKLYAVCCTSEVPVESLNRILSSVYKHRDEQNAYWKPTFVVIDDLAKTYKHATVQLDGKGTFHSPFIGKRFETIARVIRDLCLTNGSDLHYVQFMALDEECIDKDWAWLAFAEDAEEKKDSINVIQVKFHRILIRSAAFSAIAYIVLVGWPLTSNGIALASTTRTLLVP